MAALTSLRAWHRRLSAFVGVQLLLWTVSGLIFTWEPIEVVRSEASLAPLSAQPLPERGDLVPLDVVLAGRQDLHPSEAALTHRRGRWVWELRQHEGPPTLFEATTGAVLAPVDGDEALGLAEARFVPPHDSATVAAVEELTTEFKGELPAWRVAFDDDEHSAVYVDGVTGALTKVRSDTWRRFDFFWMLHIMDYDEREDFNTPWLKVFAMLGVLTSASGLGLGVLMLRARRKARGV